MTEVQLHESGERIPISVLTGFLGSGKTTLLSRLLRDPAMSDTAVVINEFGEVGLDHMLVESSSDDVIVMDSGCLCCTIRSDLVDTLRSLFRRRVTGEIPDFARLVIETTGLADPAPILHTLMTDPLLAARYRLDAVITTVDGVNAFNQLDTQFEPIKQAAVADRLLITKRDLIDEDKTAALTERLRAINPAAPIHPITQGAVDPDTLFGACTTPKPNLRMSPAGSRKRPTRQRMTTNITITVATPMMVITFMKTSIAMMTVSGPFA